MTVQNTDDFFFLLQNGVWAVLIVNIFFPDINFRRKNQLKLKSSYSKRPTNKQKNTQDGESYTGQCFKD